MPSEEEFFPVNEKPLKSEWAMSEAVSIIKSFVIECKSLEDVNEYFFENKIRDEINQKDRDFVESVYVEKFWILIPDKAKQYICDILTPSSTVKIWKWVYVVYGGETDKEFLDLFIESKFYQMLKIIIEKKKDVKHKFYQRMRKHFIILFLEARDLIGLLGIFRCLSYCIAKTKRSKVFCDAVTALLEKIFKKDYALWNITPDKNADVHIEHNLLEKLVKDYESGKDASNLEFFKERIEQMLKPIKFNTFCENGEEVFEVYGSIIEWNNISEQFFEKYNPEKIGQVRISATQEIVFTENLKFPGKNLSIIAPNIVIKNSIIFDLSGKDAINDAEMSADKGSNTGENGKDGEDGIAGGSSGNLAICTAKIQNKENLKLILNGGKGSNGQNGGDGAPGQDGIGEKFGDKFDGWYKTGCIATSFISTLYSGYIFSLLSGFYTVKQPNGIEHKISQSTYRHIKISNIVISFFTKPFTNIISSTHLMDFYKGTKGCPGGKGGKNGNGGEGGKQGTCTILSQCENEKIVITDKETKDGINGDNGNPGKNGDYGKNGWDIGMTFKGLTSTEHGRNHNQIFHIEYSSEYTDDTFYIQKLDTGERSFCYAKIKAEKCGRTILKESEKQAEKKSDADRKAEAVARKTNSINLNAVEERYEGLCKEQSEQSEEQEIEEEVESEANVNRIAETFNITKEPVYIPKERHMVPVIPNELIETIKKDSLEPWNEIWNATAGMTELSKLIVKAPSEVLEKLSKKMLLATLRRQHRLDEKIRRIWKSRKTATSTFLNIFELHAMIKILQKTVRNCAPFLVKRVESEENGSVCAGVLMGNSSYSNVYKQSIKKISNETVEVKLYIKYVEMLTELNKIKIEGKSLLDLKTEFMKGAIESSNEEIKKILDECAKVKATEKYESIFQKLGHASPGKLIILCNHVYEKILANETLAEAFKVSAKAQMSEIELDKNSRLFNENASIIDWLKVVNNKEQCNKLFNYLNKYLLKHGIKCAGGRLILAWATNTNLRIYNNNMLIEDHLSVISGNVEHFEIDEKSGAFSRLFFNPNRIKLENEREKYVQQFESRFKKAESRFKCFQMLPVEVITVPHWCATCKKMENDKLNMNQIGALKSNIVKLLSFIDGYKEFTDNHLEILCTEFPSTGISFINALINVFDVEGCHIDFTTFNYMMETVFTSSMSSNIKNRYFFPAIIFSNSQSDWMDEFFIVNLENALKAPITTKFEGKLVSKKSEMREKLRNVVDENLKALCSTKLQKEDILVKELLEIMDVMKDAQSAYPDLVDVKLEKWLFVIKDSQVYLQLNKQKYTFINEKQRNLALFWCCKLAAAKFATNDIEKVFALLGAQKNMEFDQKLFGRIVQRLCTNEIVAGNMGQQPNPSKIFAHVIKQMKNSHPIPPELDIKVLKSDEKIAEELMGRSRQKR